MAGRAPNRVLRRRAGEQIGSDACEIGDDETGGGGLHPAEGEQVAGQHGGHREVKSEGAIEGVSGRVAREEWLNTEHDPGRQSRRIQT